MTILLPFLMFLSRLLLHSWVPPPQHLLIWFVIKAVVLRVREGLD